MADDAFIILLKDRRKVSLFSYDRHSSRLYEKCFSLDYKFMQVCR